LDKTQEDDHPSIRSNPDAHQPSAPTTLDSSQNSAADKPIQDESNQTPRKDNTPLLSTGLPQRDGTRSNHGRGCTQSSNNQVDTTIHLRSSGPPEPTPAGSFQRTSKKHEADEPLQQPSASIRPLDAFIAKIPPPQIQYESPYPQINREAFQHLQSPNNSTPLKESQTFAADWPAQSPPDTTAPSRPNTQEPNTSQSNEITTISPTPNQLFDDNSSVTSRAQIDSAHTTTCQTGLPLPPQQIPIDVACTSIDQSTGQPFAKRMRMTNSESRTSFVFPKLIL
jgi:hypothetical protein